MCGIAGYLGKDGHEPDGAFIERAMRGMGHRGPDDGGWLAWKAGSLTSGVTPPRTLPPAQVLLVHRRLSIIDLSENGRQPMQTPDGRYALVFNGEIYNYLELRAELQALGYSFRTQTDSEVLLAAIVTWGTDALRRLVGMFAFALLDTCKRELLLARDFFGIKPLFYALTAGGLAFASETNVLADLVPVDRRVNAQAVFNYLRFGITDEGEQTLLEGIKQLPAAHYVRIDLERIHELQPVRYWRMDPGPPLEISFPEAVARVRELFIENVRLHLRSDVPLGTALSGGIDSSSVLMVMRHLQGPNADLHAISYIADDAALSEERWIDIVGQAANATVHKVRLAPTQLIADFQHLVSRQGEPFRSTSIYAQHRVFCMAQEAGIKVMLDGQGADEMFAGYPQYYGARLASLVRRFRLPAARRLLNGAQANGAPGRLQLLQLAARWLAAPSLQKALRQLVGKDLVPAWLNASWFARRGVRCAEPSLPHCQQQLRADLRAALEGGSLSHLLRYEDRNSMAFSIESRVPFLTPQLAEFVTSLPEEYLISADGVRKSVFREAMRGIVPDVVLDRKEKIGFETPERKWLLALRPWVENLLQSDRARELRALDYPKAVQYWEAACAGRRPFGTAIWRWINLIEWSQRAGAQYD